MAVTTEHVHEFYEYLRKHGIVPTVEKYYHDDIKMDEAGKDVTVGKAAVLGNESYFANMLEPTGHFESIDIKHVIAHGHLVAVEHSLTMRFKGNPNPVVQHQVAIQEWKDGKIIRETFYHTKA